MRLLKYTQIPANTFEKLQMNAGVFCRSFNPATGEVTGLLGASTGGGQFAATPTMSDFGDDIDNCPKNTKELKRQDDVAVTMNTTFVTIDPATAKLAMGAADIDSQDSTHIIPRRDLALTDFDELWWVGDYSNYNNGSGAGYCAIHLMNALSTGGFQMQSTDRGKGNFALELTGHYSLNAPDVVPYEVYIKSGSAANPTPEILFDKHSMTIAVDEEVQINVIKLVPAGSTITWSTTASGKVSVTNGVVKGLQEGSSIITGVITIDGVAYNDTCTVVVES